MEFNLKDFILSESEKIMAELEKAFFAAGYPEHASKKISERLRYINELLDYFDSPAASENTLAAGGSYTNPVYSDILKTASSLRAEGVALNAFLGMLKITFGCFESVAGLECASAEFLRHFRKKADLLEQAVVAEWTNAGSRTMNTALMDANRRLTIAQSRYEKIMEADGSIIIFFGENGIITDSNFRAKYAFGEDPSGYNVMEFLGINERDLQSFIRKYGEARHEILMDGQYFSVRLVPLGNANTGVIEYMFIFHNITGMVDERKYLEEEVIRRMEELEGSKKFFESVFSSAGDGIIIFDFENRLVKVNKKACFMFGVKDSQSCINNVTDLFLTGNQKILFSITRQLKESETWDGEMEMTGMSGRFSALVTLNRFDVDEKVYYSLIVRDISFLKDMERELVDEKKHVEEKNIALRNIIQSIRGQDDDLRSEMLFKMESHILPLMERLRREKDENEKSLLYSDICESISGLLDKDSTKNHSGEAFARLSRTEERICRMIVTGYTTKQIADELFVTHDTVQTHRKNIRKKLDINNKDVNLYTYLKNISSTSEQ
ncbi:LuxR C-terminal-related transcriptional regulator [Geovibrio thiophilus]|nr:LuxR C-terminal-related transcriptional regulator [Geovibrio thiophilus]